MAGLQEFVRKEEDDLDRIPSTYLLDPNTEIMWMEWPEGTPKELGSVSYLHQKTYLRQKTLWKWFCPGVSDIPKCLSVGYVIWQKPVLGRKQSRKGSIGGFLTSKTSQMDPPISLDIRWHPMTSDDMG